MEAERNIKIRNGNVNVEILAEVTDINLLEGIEAAAMRLHIDEVPSVAEDRYTLATRPQACRVHIVELTEQLTLKSIEFGTLLSPPVVVITRNRDGLGLTAVRQGAWDALELPICKDLLTAVLKAAAEESVRRSKLGSVLADFDRCVSMLSDSERAVLQMVCAGNLNKQIANELGVSIRTIENRRRKIFDVMRVPNVSVLARRVAEIEMIKKLMSLGPCACRGPRPIATGRETSVAS